MDDATKQEVGAISDVVGQVTEVAGLAAGGPATPVGLALTLIGILATNIPNGINQVQKIMDA